ncbi:MAG TPA: 4Fe-4S binding protein [Candidatus Cloacimonetes bacterium]|nr:4Fe-4S binding protein [Candidatus Cloacimonadota bacterium]
MYNLNRILFRKIIQWIFLIVSLILIFLLIQGTLKVAHQYCPYASVCFGVMGLNPTFGKFIYPTAVIIGLVILVLTIFVGRKFCGYVCPLGTIQEIIYLLNPRSKKPKLHDLPKPLHRILLIFKYIFFLITVIAAYGIFQYGYMKFCPVLAISHPQHLKVAGIISLFIVFIVAFFLERFWCRYACPYAALMNIFQWFGKILHIPRTKIIRNMEVCIDCYICDKNCPMQINICDKEIIDDVECIHCNKCMEKCPRPKSLDIKSL